MREVREMQEEGLFYQGKRSRTAFVRDSRQMSDRTSSTDGLVPEKRTPAERAG